MRIENNVFERNQVANEVLDTFITRCILMPRLDGKGPLFFEDGGKIHARLDGYAVIPKEKYEELQLAQSRLAEVEKDATRYRFLRENVRAQDRMVGYCMRAWTFDAPCDIVTLDAAIDEAIKRSSASSQS